MPRETCHSDPNRFEATRISSNSGLNKSLTTISPPHSQVSFRPRFGPHPDAHGTSSGRLWDAFGTLLGPAWDPVFRPFPSPRSLTTTVPNSPCAPPAPRNVSFSTPRSRGRTKPPIPGKAPPATPPIYPTSCRSFSVSPTAARHSYDWARLPELNREQTDLEGSKPWM